METSKNHSIRDANWHPRQSSEELVPGPLTGVELNTLKTLLANSDEHLTRSESILDPKTKAETETRMMAHLSPKKLQEHLDKEFEQENVKTKDHLGRSLKRKIQDFLNI